MNRFFLSLALLLPLSTSAQVLRNVRVNQAEELIREHQTSKDLIILDVRTPKEYSGERLDGALHIDFWGEGFVDSVSKLDRGKIYLVYCASGVRSKKAMNKMGELGFKQVYNLRGGIWAWKRKHGRW